MYYEFYGVPFVTFIMSNSVLTKISGEVVRTFIHVAKFA